jgi:hypothetical protein
MTRWLCGLRMGVAACGLALAPAPASAEPAPSFACETQGLSVGAAEVNGVRISCSVSRAPSGDQILRLVSAAPQPLCEASLSDGAAECVATLITHGPPGQVMAVLLPSGTKYQVLAAAHGDQGSPSMLYTPIPSDASPSDVDQPAPGSGST